VENSSLGLEAEELIFVRQSADLAADTVERGSLRGGGGSERSSAGSDFLHFLSAARSSALRARRASDSHGGQGEDGAGLEVSGQSESKEEEREDVRVKEASSVDWRENCSGGSCEERMERVEIDR